MAFVEKECFGKFNEFSKRKLINCKYEIKENASNTYYNMFNYEMYLIIIRW